MNNPYLKEFNSLRKTHAGPFWECRHPDPTMSHAFIERDNLVRKYAWAIPNEEAINKIASFGKIVEIGAGTGYWASLIADAGAEVTAFDIAPAGNGVWKNPYDHEFSYYKMYQGTEEWAEIFPDHTLLLCWPPYEEPMAANALAYFTGNRVVYIGEWGGCTADPDFFSMIETSPNDGATWRVVEQVSIPCWSMIVHDSMYILERV